jgi:hypothetical protein
VTIAALHALIPSHWLAFVAVGKAKRWPERRTLGIAAIAGTGHVAATVGIGLPLVYAGKTALTRLPNGLEHTVAAIALIGLGLLFLVHGRTGHGHACGGHASEPAEEEKPGQERPGHEDPHTQHVPNGPSGATAVAALVLGMTLSPCLDLLPIYVAAAALPWSVVVAISILMAVTTVSIMLGLIWLTLRGLERLRFTALERNESRAVGIILVALGLVLLLI